MTHDEEVLEHWLPQPDYDQFWGQDEISEAWRCMWKQIWKALSDKE